DHFYHRWLAPFPNNPYSVFERSNFVPDFTERLPYIKHLNKALEYALLEKNKQMDNKLYQNDLVDITKQYLGELFNYHLLQLNRSFFKGEQVGFETEAKTINRIMDDLGKIVSTREDYRIEPIIEKSLRIPGVGPDTAKRVRDSVSGFNGYEGAWNWDYNAKDFFELIKFYYLKRVDFYIAVLREKMQSHQTRIDHVKELEPTYHKLTIDWIYNDLKVKPEDRYQGSSAQAATEIFSSWKDISSLDLTPLFGLEVKFGSKVIWEDDFSQTDNWKSLGGERGVFASDGKVVTMKSLRGGVSYGCVFPRLIPIDKGLVIGFRAQLVGDGNRLSAVQVFWEDSAGQRRDTYLYP
ncbi:MAG: alpha-N-acetylglucosaminidase C-terminal domain-containing protein, partial [Candidatus Margulisiibacteriota bacterium]